MTTIRIGSNTFANVAYPIVVADRFFRFTTGPGGRLLIDVIRFEETTRQQTYEVRASRPEASIAKASNAGHVVYADERGFLFKFRPYSKTSVLFGGIQAAPEFEVRITDQSIQVKRDGRIVVTLKNNELNDVDVGLFVGSTGDVGLGGSWSAEALPSV